MGKKSNKFKPKKGIVKRVKVTATGKIKVHRQGKGHLLSGKSAKRRRRMRRPLIVAPHERKVITRLLGM
ncbi:MAG: 50S ribosomal protein L35 [Planctomycetes bacterium]|nr:50S ribosomal protein L35 [Planctomycetota bacterium]